MENVGIMNCPKCGHKSRALGKNNEMFVECPVCHCESKRFNTEGEAISSWNKREGIEGGKHINFSYFI